MIIKADELLNVMNVGVFAIDTHKKVIFANRVLRRMLFHEDPEQVDLDTIQKILRKSLLALNHEVLLDRAMFQREIVSAHEAILRDAEGVSIPVHIHIDLLLDPMGRSSGHSRAFAKSPLRRSCGERAIRVPPAFDRSSARAKSFWKRSIWSHRPPPLM